MKRIISICLVVLLALTSVSALAESMRVVNCNEWVSLRSYPSTKATRITTVPLGAVVDAHYYEGDFIYCTYMGLNGYILASYLTSAASPYDYYDTRYYYSDAGRNLSIVNCNEWVSLRSYPSTSASQIAKVPLGATVTAYDRTGDFTFCVYRGMQGYILSQYLGESSTRRIVNCNEWVSLRSAPSTSASRITKVPLGASVVFISYASNGFAYCTYNGHDGYILTKYLS